MKFTLNNLNMALFRFVLWTTPFSVAASDQSVRLMDRFTATRDGKVGPNFHDPVYPRRFSDGVIKSKDGTWRAVGLEIYYFENRGVLRKEAKRIAEVQYPPLKEGDVIPAFGRLYRVSPVVPGWWDRVHTVKFEWVGEKFADGAVNLSPDSFPVPLASAKNDWMNVCGHYIRVDKIDATGCKAGEARGTLTLDFTEPIKMQLAQVKAGDVLMLGDKGHKVIAVVPADAKTGVIGWVEFDPEPIDEADIKAQGLGARVVRPGTGGPKN